MQKVRLLSIDNLDNGKKAINRTLRRKKPEFDVIDMDEVITEKKEEKEMEDMEEMEVTKMGKISSN